MPKTNFEIKLALIRILSEYDQGLDITEAIQHAKLVLARV